MTVNLDFLPMTAFVFILVFGRVGAMVMSLPGLGDSSVPTNIRLVFALALTLVLYPVVQKQFPQFPTSLFGMVGLLGREVVIGLALGLLIRLIISGTQVAGAIVGFQTGLSFANSFDPNFGGQTNVLATLLSMVALILVFTFDLHHLLLRGIHDSYVLFSPKMELPVEDFLMMALKLVTGAFRIATQIAAPFILFGLIFYLGIGVLARLIPQIQIFFIAMPANIFVSLILLMILISSMMMAYITYFTRSIEPFLAN
jgi:flagellar biosynthetic protein FliR